MDGGEKMTINNYEPMSYQRTFNIIIDNVNEKYSYTIKHERTKIVFTNINLKICTKE